MLDVKLPFDEAALLQDNAAYLCRALGLDAVIVARTTDAGAGEAAAARGVDIGAACPGQPVAAFSATAT